MVVSSLLIDSVTKMSQGGKEPNDEANFSFEFHHPTFNGLPRMPSSGDGTVLEVVACGDQMDCTSKNTVELCVVLILT